MRSSFITWFSLAAFATVAACNGEHVGAGGGTRIFLTDAPFPFDQVERVDVHIVRVEGTANADTTTNQQWQTLVEPDRSFNLLDVQNGVTALLGESQVDAGQFAAIRMVIRTDLSSITLAGGAAASVNWAGPATQTINALVEQPLSMTTSGGGNLIIDFDVGRSFVVIPDGFQFLPWIRAVNQDATGSIGGVVTGSDGQAPAGPVARASIAVYRRYGASSLTLAATGVTDAQGHYTIHYVSGGGPYVVEAAPPTGYQAAPGYTEGVMVNAGEESAANVTLGDGSAGSGAQVEITGQALVAVGQAVWLGARVTNALGDSVVGASVTWHSTDAAVAGIEGFGQSARITGVAAGTTQIIAVSNDVADTLAVTVVEGLGAVATVELNEDTTFIPLGDTTALAVVARDAAGNVITGRTITWSFDPAVLHEERRFDNILEIRGIAAGTTFVKATIEGKSDSTRVTVR
jgi:uncharacterized protein DUF4382